ncbi:DUF2264 domain-containing protein [Natronospora cellulosivora (SeqCode)]
MQSDRNYWISIMKKIIDPVLINLSQRKLKENMIVDGSIERKDNAYLEALGRTVAGISPWLELADKASEKGEKLGDKSSEKGEKLGDKSSKKGLKLGILEKQDIEKYAQVTRQAIEAAIDPDSPDYMNFEDGGQPLVDLAFLAHGILRAPEQLWHKLDSASKDYLIKVLKSSRKIKPCYSNWLLFSAMIEAALYLMGEDFDIVRIDYAIKEHQNWYLGDGTYGDGPEFHWDYYNSFVIQPMLLDIVKLLSKEDNEIANLSDIVLKRAQRYAEILERLISPEATFPPIGRSLAYRFGVFQLLSQLALAKELPTSLAPSQVRTALTAVIRKMINMPGTFNKEGWLNIGFSGHQPDIAEIYINTGSLYLCNTVFLPLGLSPDDEFWTGKEKDWTAKRIWSGQVNH